MGAVGDLIGQIKDIQNLGPQANDFVNSVVNPTTTAPPLWTDSLDGSGGGGGGGGYSHTPAVDHFFDISPVDQANIDATNRKLADDEAQNNFNNNLATAQFNYQKSQDAAQLALSQGNLALAAQKQADANYWQGISTQLQQQQINLTNQGQQLDYASQMASIQQAREASNNNLQLGLANATNDADRNAITAKWNQEQAAIAKMQDETNRILGGQQNQTAQYNAETQRQGTMGNLALENNKFILDAATSPSDLWALWFMQRGVAPDWKTITSGGTPAQGTPIVPVNPLTAFTPTTTAPTFNGTPQNSAAAQVGQATASYSPQANPYLQMGLPNISQPLNYFNDSFIPYGTTDLSGAPGKPDITSYITQTSNVNGTAGGGVPLSTLQPGNNLYKVSGTTNGSSFSMPAYYDVGHTQPVKPGDVLQDGAGVYIDYNPQNTASTSPQPGQLSQPQINSGGLYQKMAAGGATRAPMFITGDSLSGRPTGYEEMVVNPTNAPIKVIPIGGFGDFRSEAVPRYASGTGNSTASMQLPDVLAILAALGGSNGEGMSPRQMFNPSAPLDTSQINDFRNRYFPPKPQDGLSLWAEGQWPPDIPIDPRWPPQPPGRAYPIPPDQGDRGATAKFLSLLKGTPRYAMGTDASSAYDAAGLGNLWQPTSDNSYLAGQALPPNLAALANAGVPLPPGVVAASTGQVSPTLDMGKVFTARGIGTAPSLQAVNDMTKSEADNYKGYVQGVGGVPWADFIDWLGTPTQNLQAGLRSRAA